MIKKLVFPLRIFIFIVVVDQLTKFYAFKNFVNAVKISDWLSFDLVINRGVSWSLFHSQDNSIFTAITLLVFLILLLFIYYTYKHLNSGKNIFAETLIISGGVSNFLDRLIYSGIVDFVVVSFNSWAWPSFNIADVVIVFGIFLMFIKIFLKK